MEISSKLQNQTISANNFDFKLFKVDEVDKVMATSHTSIINAPKYHPYKPQGNNNVNSTISSYKPTASGQPNTIQNRAVSPNNNSFKPIKYNTRGDELYNNNNSYSLISTQPHYNSNNNNNIVEEIIQSEEELFEKYNIEQDISSNVSDSDTNTDRYYRKVLMVLIGLAPKSILSPQQQSNFHFYSYLLLNHEYKLILDPQSGHPLRTSQSKEFQEGGPQPNFLCTPNAQFKNFRLGYKNSSSTTQRVYNIPIFMSQINSIIAEHHSRGDIHYSVEDTQNLILDSRWYWHFLRESIQKFIFKCECNSNLKQKQPILYNNNNNNNGNINNNNVDKNVDIVNILKTVVNNQNSIQKQLDLHQKSLQNLSQQNQTSGTPNSSQSSNFNSQQPLPFTVYNPNSSQNNNSQQNESTSVIQSYLSNLQIMLQNYFDQQNQILFSSLDQIKSIILTQQQQQQIQPQYQNNITKGSHVPKYSPPTSSSVPPSTKLPTFVNNHVSPLKLPLSQLFNSNNNNNIQKPIPSSNAKVNQTHIYNQNINYDPETISDETSGIIVSQPSRGVNNLVSSQNDLTMGIISSGTQDISFIHSQSANTHGGSASTSSSGDLSPPSSPTIDHISPSQELDSHIQLISTSKFSNSNSQKQSFQFNNNNNNNNNNNLVLNNLLHQCYGLDEDEDYNSSSQIINSSNSEFSQNSKSNNFDFTTPFDGDSKKKEKDRKKISNFKDTLFKTLDENQYQTRKELYFSMVSAFNEYYGKYSPQTRLVRIDDDFPQTVGEIDEYLKAHNYSSKKRDDKKNKNKIEQANNANILAKQKYFLGSNIPNLSSDSSSSSPQPSNNIPNSNNSNESTPPLNNSKMV